MHIGRIAGATRVLGAPRDWDVERDGVCIGLPIRDELVDDSPQMTSAWLPTEEEIARIVAGAPVYLHVPGTFHPPVMISVGEPAA